MKYRAVIYDCDGVMFDSFEANFAFYQKVMAGTGREPLDRGDLELMRVLHTYSNRDVLAHIFPKREEWEEAVRCASSIDYRELVPLMVMEEGFLETVEELQRRVKLGICTNRSTSMDLVLDSFGLRPFFGCVMTASKVQNPKPHPEPLLTALEQLGVDRGEALFVGDSEVDLLTARAAGVPFVAYRADLPSFATLQRHPEILQIVGE